MFIAGNGNSVTSVQSFNHIYDKDGRISHRNGQKGEKFL